VKRLRSVRRAVRFDRAVAIGVIAFSSLLVCPIPVSGTPFTIGNLLVTSWPRNLLYEYTRAGLLVQSIAVPSPPNATRAYNVGGLLVDSNGYVDVAQFSSGTEAVFLSAYQPSTQTWTHHSAAPASGIPNIADLDLASLQSKIYVSVLDSYQLDAAKNYAVARLPTSVRFDNGGNSAVSVGVDGLLYIGDASGRNHVNVVNPSTFTLIRTLTLNDRNGPGAVGIDANGLAITANGTIFAADYSGIIYKYSPTGTLLSTFDTKVPYVVSESLYPDGTLALGTRLGDVVLTNTSFSTESHFTVPDMNIDYVSFVTPEPSAAIMLALGGVALVSRFVVRDRFCRIRPVVSVYAKPR
jgi:hypothetical protein